MKVMASPMRSVGQLQQVLRQLRPYVALLHLRQPGDLLLLLLPLSWTVALAGGPDELTALLALLLAASLVRSAAWLYNDLVDSAAETRPLSHPLAAAGARHEAWSLFILLLGSATLLLLLLDALAMAWALGALLLLLAYPFIKHRTLLTQAYMGLCIAWIVPMTQRLSPEAPIKPVLLLFTATLLWATANYLCYGIYRRSQDEAAGVGSLVYLFGDNSGVMVVILQLFAVISLWFCGDAAGFGWYFGTVLLLLLTMIPWQQWLLLQRHESGALMAYHSGIASGVLLLLGLLAEQL